jgi:hypothetical protein
VTRAYDRPTHHAEWDREQERHLAEETQSLLVADPDPEALDLFPEDDDA